MTTPRHSNEPCNLLDRGTHLTRRTEERKANTMKNLAILAILLLSTVSAFGQSATLATPQTLPTRTSLVVGSLTESRADPNVPATTARVSVELLLLSADGSRQDSRTIQLTGAEVQAFDVARTTTAANETGSGTRVIDFRILTFLKANCGTFATPCPAGIATATLVP
jgi:hypothetical protein